MIKYVRTCNDCEYNDGYCYTSYPAQYKCTVDGKFHFGDYECQLEFAPVHRTE